MTDTTAYDAILTPTENCPDCGRIEQRSRDINDWERFDSGDCSRSYERIPTRARQCYELTIATLRARVSELEAELAEALELVATQNHNAEERDRGYQLIRDSVDKLKSAEPAREGAPVRSCTTCHFFSRETDTCFGPHPANGIVIDAPAHFHCSLFMPLPAPPDAGKETT